MAIVRLPVAAAAAACQPAAALVIRAERHADVAAREALLDTCFGAERAARTCQRLRDGRRPAEGLAFSAVTGDRLVGTLRLWHVNAGGKPALMLGPLAVDPACRSLGLGAALMIHALATAKRRGHGAVILLGDAPYYARFGFTAAATGRLTLPGPYERDRLLALELEAGAIEGAEGMILPTGAAERRTPSRGRRAVAEAVQAA